LPDSYTRLARFLDSLPAGYPASDNGVEVRILQKLFTPAEADLFIHLTLLPEDARAIAFRVHRPAEDVTRMLGDMDAKGLVSADHLPGRPAQYSVNQFAVGFWEEQVDRLDRELVALVDEYLLTYFKRGPWTKLPQIRTVPVGVSIPVQAEVISYERADEIVRRHTSFAVRNCICRQERRLAGHDCGKPLETCLSFGATAEKAAASGRSRAITQKDALAVLDLAEREGLVLQPANSQDPIFLCACCGCCCGVLRHVRLHERPADLVANAYIARHDPDLCLACGACAERCQMGAITLTGLTAELDPARCIGCGLCVSTCPTGALTLMRKDAPPSIPRTTAATYIQLAQSRGLSKTARLAGMVLQSTLSRLITPR
jgi:ferredoxin